MRRLLLSLLLLIAACVPARGELTSLPASGMNLGAQPYYGASFPFANIGHQNKWVGWTAGGGYETGTPTYSDDGFGEVKTLGVGATARNVLVLDQQPARYPSGHWRIQYQGTGTLRAITFGGSAYTVVSSGTGFIVVNVPSTSGGSFVLEIQATDAVTPIKKVEVYPPFPGINTDSPIDGATVKFRPGYLTEILAEHGLARFMDWAYTNNSTISTWSQRNTLDHVNWSAGSGVPIEMCVDLCNAANIDCWLCLPHLADDDYVENAVELADARLEPGRKLFLELSNECWNWGFVQAAYFNTTEVKAALGAGNVWQAYGARAAQVFEIAKDAIPDESRLVCVLGGQNAWTLPTTEALSKCKIDGVQMADALAVAPYFNLEGGVSYDMDDLYADFLTDSVDESAVFSSLGESIAQVIGWTAANHDVARSYGLQFIAYEGGQHVVAHAGAQASNSSFVAYLGALNRDARMGDCYADLLDAWYEEGGTTFVLFNDIQRIGSFGYWGLMEQYEDTSAPKYLAVQDYYGDFDDTLPVEQGDPVGLIHHYALGETSGTTAIDTGLIPVNGTYARNATNTTYTASSPGTAITHGQDFIPASNDYVDISAASVSFLSGTDDGTVSFWYRADGAATLWPIGRAAASGGSITAITDTQMRVNGAANYTVAAMGTTIHLHTVTFTDGKVSRYYLDGAASSSNPQTWPDGTWTFNAICRSNGFTSDGKIWDVRVYNYALSGTEVSDLYAGRDLPVITSNGGGASAAIEVAAGETQVTTVQGTNNGAAVSYAIVGGGDAAWFTIDTVSGALSFIDPPNFEAPTDADGDNEYLVDVAVNGPGGADSQSLAVTVAAPPRSYRVRFQGNRVIVQEYQLAP